MPARCGLLVLVLSALLAATPCAGACQIERVKELTVTLREARPLVPAEVNGSDALFIPDAGAFYSLLTPASASQYALSLHRASYDPHLGGARASTTRVKSFALSGTPMGEIEFLVGGAGLGSGVAGLLGRNVLGIADAEYDLAHGVIRLLRPRDCGSTVLAYWLEAGQAYSVLDVDAATADAPHLTGAALVNGQRIRVMFEPGLTVSMLADRAARAAGATQRGSDFVSVASFKIGDEEIRNTRLRSSALAVADVDMVIGADFFRSHRIYVSGTQGKIYFTYSGGPVFDTGTP